MNSNLNVIKTYDDMLYDSRPASFNEFINDKYNNVHNELYNDALNKYYDDIIDTLISSRFVYEFYKHMQNNSDTFDMYYSYIESLDNNSYIKKTLSSMGINGKNLLNIMFDITNVAFENVKQSIYEKNIIKGISSITDISDFRVLYVYNATFIGPENENETFNTVFASYKIQKESDINSYTLIETNIYGSELNDYVFILEEEDGTRIGYNKDGEWLLILDSEHRYKNIEEFANDLNYNINDLTEEERNSLMIDLNNLKNEIREYVSNKSKCLINLYKLKALEEYKGQHKIIEIKNSEYWMPSSICVISTNKPYKKEIVDLSKYWNMNQSMNDISIYDIKNTNENINDSELYEINYITGIAKIRSRSTGLEYETPFKYLDGDINVSEDMTINKTFTAKYNEYNQ